MTREYWLKKRKRNSTVQKDFLWELLASSFLIRFNFVSCKRDQIDRILTLSLSFEMRSPSALFSLRLEISDRKLNESEFSNRIWTYFRFLMSIESISKRIFFWSHSIIFFHLRFHLIQDFLKQLFDFLMFISYSLW